MKSNRNRLVGGEEERCTVLFPTLLEHVAWRNDAKGEFARRPVDGEGDSGALAALYQRSSLSGEGRELLHDQGPRVAKETVFGRAELTACDCVV